MHTWPKTPFCTACPRPGSNSPAAPALARGLKREQKWIKVFKKVMSPTQTAHPDVRRAVCSALRASGWIWDCLSSASSTAPWTAAVWTLLRKQSCCRPGWRRWTSGDSWRLAGLKRALLSAIWAGLWSADSRTRVISSGRASLTKTRSYLTPNFPVSSAARS